MKLTNAKEDESPPSFHGHFLKGDTKRDLHEIESEELDLKVEGETILH
jgi:hypothetical protein